MGLTDKLQKKLLENPDYQYAFCVGLINTLNEKLDSLTDDVLNQKRDVSKFYDQIMLLSKNCNCAILKMHDATIRGDINVLSD